MFKFYSNITFWDFAIIRTQFKVNSLNQDELEKET